jgi:hypothetical protein
MARKEVYGETLAWERRRGEEPFLREAVAGGGLLNPAGFE